MRRGWLEELVVRLLQKRWISAQILNSLRFKINSIKTKDGRVVGRYGLGAIAEGNTKHPGNGCQGVPSGTFCEGQRRGDGKKWVLEISGMR